MTCATSLIKLRYHFTALNYSATNSIRQHYYYLCFQLSPREHHHGPSVPVATHPLHSSLRLHDLLRIQPVYRNTNYFFIINNTANIIARMVHITHDLILYIIAIDVFKFQQQQQVAYFEFGAPTSNSRRFSMEHRSEITSFCFGSDFFANEGSQDVFFGSQNSATF
jgi:hypothetical protein